MLTRLAIHDVVLIDKLALDFAPGLNVFTGETGAGKSILLDALNLALGGRSDASLIRTGAAQASVTAEFSPPESHNVFALLNDQGLSAESPLILRRVVGKDGKSRAFINDQSVSIGLLKTIGETLLEIHGQFETHGLLNPASHRGLLDAFGELGKLRDKTAAAYHLWQEAADQHRQALAERDRAQAEEDFLRAAVGELNTLAPEPGEADSLATKRSHLQHREKILEALEIASQALNGERGTLASLAQAGKSVARVLDKAPNLQPLLTALDQAAHDAAEAANLLERHKDDIDGDSDTLQRIEERLFSLRGIARKHNVAVDDLPQFHTDLTARLGLLIDQGDGLTALSHAAATARAAYIKHAKELSAKRIKAAAQFQKAVMAELPPLKLERAQFIIDVTPLPPEQGTADGLDRVSFLAATNAGMPAGSLQKVASGGELARFMLAIKVVLAANDSVPTLVFDEVDTGIGGATASAVGERLARLAHHVQILVVTHSPQVAARGTTHLRVAKATHGKHTITSVSLLAATERREEIARMLAGAQVTDAARDAAASLLEDTTAPKTGTDN